MDVERYILVAFKDDKIVSEPAVGVMGDLEQFHFEIALTPGVYTAGRARKA